MRLVSVALLLVVLGLCTTAVYADPNGAVGKPYYPYLGDQRTTYAEQEPNDTCSTAQAMACGDLINPAFLDPGNLDWYQWNMNAGDQLTCGTQPPDGGSCLDTVIELYANDCASLLASNDDSNGTLCSQIANFPAPYTGVYYLKVRGYSSSYSGGYKFYVNCGTPPPPPANDLCSGAIAIERCTSGSVQGDNTAYHNDYDPGSGGCSSGYPEAGKDAVYYVNAQVGDVLHMIYTQFNFDTAFYVVTDCSNVPGSCVAGADDTLTGEPEQIDYTVVNNGTYYIILDSYGTDSGGPWSMDYNFECPTIQACCFADGSCQDLYPGDCRAAGGTPEGNGTSCATFSCPPPPSPQACCFADGSCQDLLPNDCRAQGGHPEGEGTDCATFTCPPVATTPSSWGKIKAGYR